MKIKVKLLKGGDFEVEADGSAKVSFPRGCSSHTQGGTGYIAQDEDSNLPTLGHAF